MKRYIKKSALTQNHMATLVELGYEVVEAVLNIRKGGVVSAVPHFEIECSEQVVTALDLSTPELATAAYKDLTSWHRLLSYGTSVKLPTEKVALNGPYVAKVSAVECRAKDGTLVKIDFTPLVTKGAKVMKAPAVKAVSLAQANSIL